SRLHPPAARHCARPLLQCAVETKISSEHPDAVPGCRRALSQRPDFHGRTTLIQERVVGLRDIQDLHTRALPRSIRRCVKWSNPPREACPSVAISSGPCTFKVTGEHLLQSLPKAQLKGL